MHYHTLIYHSDTAVIFSHPQMYLVVTQKHKECLKDNLIFIDGQRHNLGV